MPPPPPPPTLSPAKRIQLLEESAAIRIQPVCLYFEEAGPEIQEAHVEPEPLATDTRLGG